MNEEINSIRSFKQLKDELILRINTKSNRLTIKQKNVAHYLIENLSNISNFDTIPKLADFSGVSTSTASVTIFKLNLAPYIDFAEKIKKALDLESNKKYETSDERLIAHSFDNKDYLYFNVEDKYDIEELYDQIILYYSQEYYEKCEEKLVELFKYNVELINSIDIRKKYTLFFIAASFGLDEILDKIYIDNKSKNFEFWNKLVLIIKDKNYNKVEEFINQRTGYYNVEEKYTIDLILINVIDYSRKMGVVKERVVDESINLNSKQEFINIHEEEELIDNINKSDRISLSYENKIDINKCYIQLIDYYYNCNYGQCEKILRDILEELLSNQSRLGIMNKYILILIGVSLGVEEEISEVFAKDIIYNEKGYLCDLVKRLLTNNTWTIEKYIKKRRSYYRLETDIDIDFILDNVINYYKRKPLVINYNVCDKNVIEDVICKYEYMLQLYKNRYFIDCKKELEKLFEYNKRVLNNLELDIRYTICFISISFGYIFQLLEKIDINLLDNIKYKPEYDLVKRICDSKIEGLEQYINKSKTLYSFNDSYTINIIMNGVTEYYNNINKCIDEKEVSLNNVENFEDEYKKLINNLVDAYNERNIENMQIELERLISNKTYCEKIIEYDQIKQFILGALVFSLDYLFLKSDKIYNYIKNNRCPEALLYNIYKDAISKKILEEISIIPKIMFEENRNKFILNDIPTINKLNILLNQDYIINQPYIFKLNDNFICKEDNRAVIKFITFLECTKNNEKKYVKAEAYRCLLCEKIFITQDMINELKNRGYEIDITE